MTPDTPAARRGQGPRRLHAARASPSPAASARMLGGDVVFDGGQRRPTAATRSASAASGTASAEALRQCLRARHAGAAGGRLSPGRRRIGRRSASCNGRPEISLASNLVGVAIDLPAPLAKAAATPLALRFRTAPDEAGCRRTRARRFARRTRVRRSRDPARRSRRRIAGEFRARGERRDEPRRRGAIRVGEARVASADRAVEPTPLDPIEAVALPAQGVTAQVALKRLDVDAWQTALAVCRATARGRARPGRRRWRSMPRAARAMCPTRSRCRVGELVAGARRLDNVVGRACRQQADALARQRRRRPAQRLCRVPRRRGAARPAPGGSTRGCRRLSLPQERRRAGREPARGAAGDGARRSTSWSTTSSCAASGSAASRSRRRTARASADGGARMAAGQAQPDDARSAAHRQRPWGAPARRRDRGAPRGDGLQARPRRQRRLARAARHGPRAPRRQGLARRPGRRGPARRSRPTTRAWPDR